MNRTTLDLGLDLDLLWLLLLLSLAFFFIPSNNDFVDGRNIIYHTEQALPELEQRSRVDNDTKFNNEQTTIKCRIFANKNGNNINTKSHAFFLSSYSLYYS